MQEHREDSLTTLNDVPAPQWFHEVGGVRDCYALTVVEHGRTTSRLIYPPACVVVGRGPGVDVEIDGRLASRKHAAIHFGDKVDQQIGPIDVINVEDLGSRNGTTVGKARLKPRERSRLQPGETVSIGLAIIMLQKLPMGSVAPTVLTRDALLSDAFQLAAAGKGVAIVKLSFAKVVDPTWLATLLANVFGKSARLADWGGNSWRVACLLEDEATTREASDFASARLAYCGLHATSEQAFLSPPMDGERLRRHPLLAAEAGARWTGLGIVARSRQIREVLELAERVAKSDLSVLILGETGAGKELVASAIHDSSLRARRPLLRLNCASLNEALLESELFGHEAGAFTGAKEMKKGLLEQADGSTVFLDEVAELPLTVQAKLLRVVETRQFMRVGGGRVIPADVRFVSATNGDLLNGINKGGFREDLYYRLAGFTIHVPPLRERPDDIQVLAEMFLHRVAGGVGMVLRFSDEALAALLAYPWPGNVRELKNVVVRAALLCDGPTVLLAHLLFDQDRRATPKTREYPSFDTLPQEKSFPFHDPVAAREFISYALETTAGNQTQAAKLLGISRRALVNRLQDYGLPRPRQASGRA